MSSIQLGIKISADGSKAILTLNQVAGATKLVGSSNSYASTELKRMTADLMRQSDAARQSARAMAEAQAAAKSAESSFSGLGTAIGLVTSVMSGRELYGIIAEYDRLNASLKTVTGSTQTAVAVMDGLKQFARETPYELSQVTEAFIRLRSMGLDASMESMRSMGNTASAMGKPLMQFIEAVADASTNEFERLKEFGIKAKQEGDQVTFTFQGVETTVQKSATAIQEYLLQLGRTKFAGGMVDQMNTVDGALSNVRDSFSQLVDTIGNLGVRDALKKGFAGVTEFLDQLRRDIESVHGMGTSGAKANLENQIAMYRNIVDRLSRGGADVTIGIGSNDAAMGRSKSLEDAKTKLAELEKQLASLNGEIARTTETAKSASRSAGSGAGGVSTPLGIAQQFQGMTERGNAEALTRFLNEHSGTVFNNLTVPWCARFVNASLDKAGIKGTGSAAARSFETFGKGIWQRGMSKDALADVQPGDIAVFTRKGGGHVGFIKAIDPSKGLLEILGGNQSNAVSVAKRSMQDLLAVRRPIAPGTKGEYEDFDKFTKRSEKEQKDAQREAEKRLKDSTQRYIANLDDQAKAAQRQAEVAISGIDNQISALDRERDAWDKNQQDKLDAAKGSYDAMAQLEAERAATLQDYAGRELGLIQKQFDARKQAMDAAASAFRKQLTNPNLTDDEERRAKQSLADVQADLVKLANEREQAEAKAGQAAIDANRGGMELAQKQRDFIAGVNAELAYQTQLYAALKAAKEQGATPQQLDIMATVSGQMRDAGQSVSAQELLALEPLLTKLEEIKQKKQELLGVDQQVREEQLRINQAFQEATDQARLFAQQATEAFGQFGDSIGQMVVGIAQFGQQSMQVQRDMQDDLEKLRKSGKSTPEKEAAIQMKAATKSAQYQISLYGDISEAAAGFFEEGSKGYASLSLASKAFRAFEMAMAVQSAVQQITSNAQVLFSDTARTTAETTNAAIRGQAKAAEAVANQGSGGDPYSAFPRMAAMAAIMAALGFGVLGAVAGGSSKTASAAERQKMAGTGTVWGDSSAQSDSIAGSLDMLRDNSNTDLSYSAAMVASLRNIEQGIAGLTNSIIAGVSPQVNPGQLGSSKLFAGSLFSSVKKEISDYGIKDIPQTIAQIIKEGFAGQVYTDIKRTTKIFGMTIGESVKTQLSELDGTVAAAFTSTIKSVVANIGVVGNNLGINAASFKRKLDNFVVDLGNISLKGLSGQEITDTLNATFGKLSDELMAAAIPGLGKFRQAGEGYAKTAVRVADGLNRATGELERLGITAISYKEIANKQGDVAAEIIRQSIATAEAGSSIGKFIEVADGAAEDLIDAYKQLTKARTIFLTAGIDTSGITQAMTNAAGGVSAFLSSMEDFRDSFLTDNEKLIGGWQDMASEFTKLGLKMPTTNDEFKALVKGIDTSTEAGQKLFGRVVALSSSFADLTSAMDDAKGALQDAYDTAKEQAQSLRDYLNSLQTGNQANGSLQDRYSAAKRQYEETLAKANTGDQAAIDALQGTASTFLDLSRQMFGSTAAYTADLQKVEAGMGSLATSIDNQVAAAEEQYAWLKANTDALVGLAEAMRAYETTMAKVNGIQSSQTGKGVGDANDQNNADAAARQALAERQRVADLYENQLNDMVRELRQAQENGNTRKIKELKASIAWLEGQVNASAQNLFALWTGKKFDVQLRAKGGYTPPGLTLVGEQGPELVNFTRPAQVYTAQQTREALSGMDSSRLEARISALEATIEANLSAGIKVDQSGYRALLAELQAIRSEMSEQTRAQKLKSAA